jgi:hypothetical protein
MRDRAALGRLTLFLLIFGQAPQSGDGARSVPTQDKSFVAPTQHGQTELFIRYKVGESEAAISEAKKAGLEVVYDYKPGLFLKCRRPLGSGVVIASEADLEKKASITKVIQHSQDIHIPTQKESPAPPLPMPTGAREPGTNDKEFIKLWGLRRIHAPEAWVATPPLDRPLVIAIIDTGVDYRHEDLRVNMWRNPGEVPGDRVDNDHNGFVDDVVGGDFTASTPVDDDQRRPIKLAFPSSDPMDDNGHGTHVAGTIAAEGNNGVGIAGVCRGAQIMALKSLDKYGRSGLESTIFAIGYAIEKKADIINCSWHTAQALKVAPLILQEAFDRAERAGILIVAAAGNESTNNDEIPRFYPSSLDNDCVVAVTATDEKDDLRDGDTGFAHGQRTVHICAPGIDILSTLPGNRYGYKSGTSQATAYVSGAAALIWGHPDYRNLNAVELKRLLMRKVHRVSSLSGKCAAGGVLDVGFLSSVEDKVATINLRKDLFIRYERGHVDDALRAAGQLQLEFIRVYESGSWMQCRLKDGNEFTVQMLTKLEVDPAIRDVDVTRDVTIPR